MIEARDLFEKKGASVAICGMVRGQCTVVAYIKIARTRLRSLPPSTTGAATMMAATASIERHISSPNR